MVRFLRVAHVSAILAGAAVLLSAATMSVEEDHDTTPDPTAVTLPELRDVLERHPLDYRGYLLEAIALTRDHEEQQAIPVLNHALRLHPTHPGLHLFLGEILRESGRLDQAAVEYASALRSSPDPGPVIVEIAARMPSAKLIARSIPPDYYRFDAVLAVLAKQNRFDVAVEWLQRVLATGPDKLRACASLYSIAARSKNLEAISIATQKCPQYSPTPQVRRYLARTALENHDPQSVLRLLSDVESWRGAISDKFEAWLTRCDAYVQLGKLDEAERCLHMLDATGYAPKREIIEKRIASVQSTRAANENAATTQPPALIQWIVRAANALAH